MKPIQTIPQTFLGVGYTRDRAGLPLEALRVPVPQPAADEVLIRVAALSLNPLETSGHRGLEHESRGGFIALLHTLRFQIAGQRLEKIQPEQMAETDHFVTG